MTLKVGRVSLKDYAKLARPVPRRVDRDMDLLGFATARTGEYGLREFDVQGLESGAPATIDATMDALVKEGQRYGAVYVVDDYAKIPEGWYELEDVDVGDVRSGSYREWQFGLVPAAPPFVVRQAEDDNVAGSDTAELDADEAKKVAYTCTASNVLVLDPRNVAGAEKFNLPYGDWRVKARAYPVSTATVKLQAKLTDLTGAAIATGSQVVVTPADAWKEVDLGKLTVPKANDKANWYEVYVQDPTNVNAVWIDRVRFIPAS